ncbi:helix-turn-helix domain-containing protein [Pararcticibacter amylolyticus]|uniref:XRE family transcriptional regulator n=1 Tax=Pararcticibacter amylolyticus TaxID=2173175 RepID=A0A2U2P9W7_9SPHI|nr:helix-turn-helix transcriptional regulator [Pararcticibacter amylolyticus]PWG78094.1 XRE family transcriptional regulator [Pararcticibacter amylolyticus]
MEKEAVEYKQVAMSHLDYLLIIHVKKLRENKGWSQRKLSDEMHLTKGFVGNVEAFTQRLKYNIRHLTLLCKAFGYKSVSKLFPFETPEHDWVRLTIKINTKVKKDGTFSRERSSEVIKVEPLKKGEEQQKS